MSCKGSKLGVVSCASPLSVVTIAYPRLCSRHQRLLNNTSSTTFYQVRTGLHTGSAQDLATKYDIPDRYQFFSVQPISIITANGESSSYLQGKVRNETLGCNFTPYLLESTPPVMSVGIKCMDEGYDFVWRAGKEPYFQNPDGVRIQLTVRDYIILYRMSRQRSRKPCLASHVRDLSLMLEYVLKLLLHQTVHLLPPSLLPLRWPYLLKSQRAQVMRGVMMMRVGEKKKKPAGRLSPPASLTGRSSRQRMILTLVMMPWTITERGRGEALLKREAQSIAHLMTHIPKNEFCDVCCRAKMIKYLSRARGGSRQIKAESFGDHVTGDFLITAKGEEAGDEDEGIGLVLKDVFSGYTYVYPSAPSTPSNTLFLMKL